MSDGASTGETLVFNIRGPQPDDAAFIMSNWINEMRHSSFSRFIDSSIYKPKQRHLIETALAKSKVIVACNPEFSYQIYGCLVYQEKPTYLHWAYVKDDFRGLGLAREMLRYVEPLILTSLAPTLVCSQTGVSLFKRDKKTDGAKTEENPTVRKYKLQFDPFDFLKGK